MTSRIEIFLKSCSVRMPECGLAYHALIVAPRRNEPAGRVLHLAGRDAELREARCLVLVVLHLHELRQVRTAAEILTDTADHQDLHLVVHPGLVEQIG